MIAIADDSTLKSLLGHLERNATATQQDNFIPALRPTLSLRELKQRARIDRVVRPFRSIGTNGGEFESPKYVRPKLLDTWTVARLTEPAGRRGSQMKFHSHSEPFPEARDEMCHEMHREWLKKHHVRHNEGANKIHAALKRLERAQEALGNHERKRQLTRDLLTKDHVDLPELSDNVLSALGRVRVKVHATHKFQLASTFKAMSAEADRDKERLERAKSDPILQIRPPTPKGQVKHRNAWQCNDRNLRHLPESTPWRERDMDIALATWKAAKMKPG